MAFHFLNTNAVAVELKEQRVSERDTFLYYLGNTVLWTLVLYFWLFQGARITWMFWFESVVVLLITILGLLKAFEVNGGPDGHQFVIRATCLSLPIGIKVYVASFDLGWVYYFAFPSIVDPGTFREPERIFDLIEFIWAPGFTALFFWRLWVHFVGISKTHAPNHAPQPTQ